MNPSLQRASLLLHQSRYKDAEAELRRALADDPESFEALAMMAACLSAQDRHPEALGAAEEAVRRAPDVPFTHFVHAQALLNAKRRAEAMTAINEALRLDPEDPDAHHLKAIIHFETRDWRAALDAADRGLALDPEHLGCLNLRATSLVQLGERARAADTLRSALARDPDNAWTHANQGWRLLHDGKPREALDHFREALRLNPELDWARQGVVVALKARYFVYRMMLAYFLWMSRLSGRFQWFIIIGLWLVARLVGRVSESHPALAPYAFAFLICYGIFFFLTWTADSLFNLLLRVHPIGKMALSAKQALASNVVGLLLLNGIGALAAGFAIANRPLLVWGMLSGLLIVPASASLEKSSGWRQGVLVAWTIALGLFAAGAALLPRPAASTALLLFLLGLVGFTWGANLLLTTER